MPLRRLQVSGLLALVSLAFAQNSTPQTPVFKAKTELVTVPVIVTDRAGTHITSLSKDDFVVLEDGKEQKISSFQEIQKSNKPEVVAPAAPGQFSNIVTTNREPARLTILALDLVNTPFESQAYASQQLLRYLEEASNTGQPTSLVVLTSFGMKVVHDFTTDPAALAGALKKVSGQKDAVDQANQEAVTAGTPPQIARMIELQRKAEQRVESKERMSAIRMTLSSLQQIAQFCAGLPGRKAVLWATGGFPFAVNELNMRIGPSTLEGPSDVMPLYEQTWQELNQAQVAVYPIDVNGVLNPTLPDISMRDPRPEFYSHAEWMHGDTIHTFRTFADSTGGRAFYSSNDLKTAFKQAADDNNSYYMLGYYLDRADKKPGWHKISVRVKRPATLVRARTGFFLTDPSPQDQQTAVRIALGSPLNYTAISITGKWQEITASTEPGKKKAIFLLTLPPSFAEIDASDGNHMRVEFISMALTGTGEIAGTATKTMDAHLKDDSLKQIRDSGFDYRGSLNLPPGDYTVHFVVQDRLSGRIGSVLAPLKITAEAATK